MSSAKVQPFCLSLSVLISNGGSLQSAPNTILLIFSALTWMVFIYWYQYFKKDCSVWIIELHLNVIQICKMQFYIFSAVYCCFSFSRINPQRRWVLDHVLGLGLVPSHVPGHGLAVVAAARPVVLVRAGVALSMSWRASTWRTWRRTAVSEIWRRRSNHLVRCMRCGWPGIRHASPS